MDQEELKMAMAPVIQSANSWDSFLQTGNIEAYLLYKYASGHYDNEVNNEEWQKSERRALS
ncbi:MAG: YqzL family protein [Clostridia bacterium]|nr:YqzL family protein [Clostridia bacterium]MBQ2670514.1 YqzL family protein [Clostridia bacterium]MBQ3461495.1 YqzL family protein [Clostridia bacterium]MBQ3471166.1 YqzL family protein [Clostridia bacterium]MBQ6530464.1 YqzL family protein [Clostridia bacterium]